MEISIEEEQSKHPELRNEKIIDLADTEEQDAELFDSEDLDESSYNPKEKRESSPESIACCDNEECDCDSELSDDCDVDETHIQLAKVLDKHARLAQNRKPKVGKRERLGILVEACADCYKGLRLHPADKKKEEAEEEAEEESE